MRLDRVDARLTEVEIDGETTVYNPVTDKVVLLNASASEIWRRTPVTSVDALAAEIAEVFGIEVHEARAGVEAGIDLLRQEHLLVEAPVTEGEG